TTIDFTYDVPVSTQLQANLSGLNIEQMSDLDIIVFIQNPTTKAVMQTKIASNALATAGFNLEAKVKLYPNPSNGIVRIATQNPVKIVITDMTGKVVHTLENAVNESQMNLSELQKGIYLAKIIGDNGEQTQKIILQ
ncbi:MAG: T9SS type A sorting domain-containing protein, partial [Flavisolibacter sp.]|nr:T9SS type A sorting domain-containing protein [Flavisolibacter sp.]